MKATYDADHHMLAIDLPGHPGTPGCVKHTQERDGVLLSRPDGGADVNRGSRGMRSPVAVTSTEPTAEQREALITNMAEAGQMLARQWGHSEWSDSWARLVAETLLREVFSDDWRCECGDLNRVHEAFCYRCGAGQPEG